jgi:hypothetical protein
VVIFTYNLKTKDNMKKEIVIERVFQVWAIGLGIVAVVGVVVAVGHLINGDVSSTTAFEF